RSDAGPASWAEREANLQLQQCLVVMGYLTQADMDTGPGWFGPKTEAAVHAFQSIHHKQLVNAPDELAQRSFGAATRQVLIHELWASSVPSIDLSPLSAREEPSPEEKTMVERLQACLVKLGVMAQADMDTGPGFYGPKTTASVKAFQFYFGGMGKNATGI